MSLTVREIAKIAGTSPSSVSLVLNNKPGVRKEMRQKIEHILRENGYQIKGQEVQEPVEMKKIYFIYYKSSNWIAKRKDNFLARVLDGIESASQKACCEVTLVNANYDNIEQILKGMTKDRTDGVIFLGTEFAHNSQKLRVKMEVPFLCIDRFFDEDSFQCINIDNKQSHYQSLRYLMELGHRKIGYLTSELESGALSNRKETFYEVMRKLGLEVNEDYVIYLNLLQEEAETALDAHLHKMKDLPTAFLACNDVIAIAAMHALGRAGYRIPEDISIIGFDNSGICDMVVPGLTTVHANLEKMGSMAIERIRELIDGKNQEVLKVTIGTKLICRESASYVKKES